MTIWYALSGVLTVRDCAESRDLITEFNTLDMAFNADIVSEGDGMIVLSFDGADNTTHMGVSEVDEAAQALSPYVTAPSFLSYYDGEPGYLYVGPADREEEAQSKHTFQEICALVQFLKPPEIVSLRQLLLDQHPIAVANLEAAHSRP